MQADWHDGKPDWEGAADAIARRAGDEPLVVEPGIEALAANRYLHRKPVTTSPTTSGVWIVIAPRRSTRRGFDAGRIFPHAGVPRFWLSQTVSLPHGFVLQHLVAAAPQRLDIAALGPDLVGGAPAILAPGPTR